ncbi:MAG TPA: prepilin peptidase [Iamia sp.]|nr:prepilin peptidase [Iamia sp.]
MGELPLVGLVFLGIGGLVVGSFLNVVIVRMPAGESIVSPPSRCPECEAPIAPRDNIPVLSWLLLRGRCRGCGEPIPVGYPLVELANAVLWVVVGLRFGTSWALVPMLVLFSTLLAQSVIDLELYRLLDKITFPVLGASVVLVAVVSAVEGDASRVGLALVGGLAYGLFLGVPAMIMPRGMGLGDVKLALLLGLPLGWIHPLLIMFALILACLLGIVVGVGMLVVRRGESQPFPFGPWLALGCILAIVFSQPLLDVYHAHTALFLEGPGTF